MNTQVRYSPKYASEQFAWFNNRRVVEPLGYIPPREYEKNYYRQTEYQKAA